MLTSQDDYNGISPSRDSRARPDDAQIPLDAMRHNQPQDISKDASPTSANSSSSDTPALMDLDKNIIGWENRLDPQNPRNFTPARKWLITSLLSALGFMTSFASSIIAPSLLFIQKEFGFQDLTLAALPVSIFLLGYAVGPLFLSPLSEIHGRHIVMISSNVLFCIWTIGCALAPSLATLITFRFLSGVGGSASQTISGAIVADLFPIENRGRALGVWMVGSILGPSCAPLIGAFIADSIGWRWAIWITLIPSVIVVGALAVFSQETNHQVLLQRKTTRMRTDLNRPELMSCYATHVTKPLSKLNILRQGLCRPIMMLLSSALIFGISVYIAFGYGCLYLLFTTIPIVFQNSYGWSIGITGVVYLALLIGYAVGLAIFYLMSDRIVVRMTKSHHGIYEPEMRLPVCIYLSFLVPVSFFWYGWSSEAGTHWTIPVLGLVLFGIGFESIWLPTQAYIVDAYPQYSASALAACSVMRSIVAAFLPLAGPGMYEALGVGWGNTVLGLVATALVPVPLLAYRFGKRIRKKERKSF